MHFDDIPIVLPLFAFHLLKGSITGLKWNETAKYLASCSLWDGWIKVKFHSFDANWLTNGKRTGQEMTSLISYFPPFVSDLVDGQRRSRPQFEGRFLLFEFGLAPEGENGGRRQRN